MGEICRTDLSMSRPWECRWWYYCLLPYRSLCWTSPYALCASYWLVFSSQSCPFQTNYYPVFSAHSVGSDRTASTTVARDRILVACPWALVAAINARSFCFIFWRILAFRVLPLSITPVRFGIFGGVKRLGSVASDTVFKILLLVLVLLALMLLFIEHESHSISF
jgi:hypothetical protein